MRGLLQICSYVHFKLSRRTAIRKCRTSTKIRTDLQQSSPDELSRRREGILTAEAALVLPLFLFVGLMFCYLFQVMEFQLKLQAALNQTAEQTASYGYLLGRVAGVAEQRVDELLEKTGLFSEKGLLPVDDAGEWVMKLLGSLPAESALKKVAASYMDTRDGRMLRVVEGWEGVSFKGSSIRDEERCVVVVAEYRIRVPFVPEVLSGLTVCQSAVCRLHCGDRDYTPMTKEDVGEEEQEKQIYFVTPNGSVYHLHRDCRYLKFTILSTNMEALEFKRNNSGGKYYPCSLCAEGIETEGVIYYTNGGSSYHTLRDCSSLKRTVLEKTKEEIAGLPPCSSCGQE